MKEVFGDIWDYHNKGNWVVVSTNGTVRTDGACVMGRGIALQAKQKFPKLPHELGENIQSKGNQVYVFDTYQIITVPVKHHYWERADLSLIEEGVRYLSLLPVELGDVYLPRLGCGNGKLDWNDVRPVLEKYLDDRFVVVELHTTKR